MANLNIFEKRKRTRSIRLEKSLAVIEILYIDREKKDGWLIVETETFIYKIHHPNTTADPR